MQKSIFYAAILLVLAGAFSCNKSDDDTTKASLSGLAVDADNSTYMPEGSVVKVKANLDALTTSDGSTPTGSIGLYYFVNSGTRDTLTLDAKASNPTYSAKLDEAGNYTISCYAFSTTEEYYSTSATISVTVVNPETALDGLAGARDTQIAGNLYYTLEAGEKTWMGNNLYGTEYGKNFNSSEVMSSVFGKFYTWEEAQGACPEGWHLPSALEFDECLGNKAGDLMANVSFNAVTMWEYWPQVVITNTKAFNAIPAGYLDLTYSTAPESGYKEYACFWTADEKEDMGIFRYIYEQTETVQKGQGSKESLALSVRCVKD